MVQAINYLQLAGYKGYVCPQFLSSVLNLYTHLYIPNTIVTLMNSLRLQQHTDRFIINSIVSEKNALSAWHPDPVVFGLFMC